VIHAFLKRAAEIAPFRLKYELFYGLAKSLGVTAYQVDGQSGQIFGHLYDQTLMKNYLRDRYWSSDIAEMISEEFGDGPGTFYDIGANIGTIIIPVAKNRKLRCIGFEPDPGNYALLSANVAVNGASNIELMRIAVAHEKGQMHFQRASWNAGDHHLSADGDLVVDVVALDDLPMPAEPFVAKIDVQGAEPAIFEGGERTLARADLIICEFSPFAMRRMDLEPERMLRFARSNFEWGCVLHDHEKLGQMEPIESVIAKLEEVAKGSREIDQVDLILKK